MDEMMNEAMVESAIAQEPVNAYANTTEPVAPQYSYQEQPQVQVEEADNSKLGGLLIAGAVAVGYAAGAVVEKAKNKIAAKKAAQPEQAKPAKKRWGLRNPFYRVEEPVQEAPAAPAQNQNSSENSEQK